MPEPRLIDTVSVKCAAHPGCQYVVSRYDNWTYTCTCPEFKYQGGCRHGFELLVRHGVVAVDSNADARTATVVVKRKY